MARFFSTNHNSLLRIATNEIVSFCIDHRSRQMFFFRAKAGQRRRKKAGFRVMLKYFEKKGFSLLYKTSRLHFAVCLRSDSVIDHRRRQNVVGTSVTHSATPRVPLFLFLPHFDVIYDLLLNRLTETWNLFVKVAEHSFCARSC